MATFKRMGENVNRFIQRQQQNAIINRNQPVDIAPKIKLNPVKTSAVDTNLSPVNRAKKKKRRIPATLRG